MTWLVGWLLVSGGACFGYVLRALMEGMNDDD